MIDYNGFFWWIGFLIATGLAVGTVAGVYTWGLLKFFAAIGWTMDVASAAYRRRHGYEWGDDGREGSRGDAD